MRLAAVGALAGLALKVKEAGQACAAALVIFGGQHGVASATAGATVDSVIRRRVGLEGHAPLAASCALVGQDWRSRRA
jgi:hypothetical protein